MVNNTQRTWYLLISKQVVYASLSGTQTNKDKREKDINVK